MARGSPVPYDPSSYAVPETASGNDYLNVQASPQDMGAQVGQAVEKLGATGEQLGEKGMDLATQFAHQATEAKVSDDYANKYAPAAAQLRQKFDLLEGQDKVHGYEDYINGLRSLNQGFSENESSPLGKQLIGGLIDRHIAGEIDGAKRELVESQKQFSHQATYDLIKANNRYAADNYNNTALVNSIAARNDSHVTMNFVDNGHDPNDATGSALMAEEQKRVRGEMATGMIARATAAGDVVTANKIRADYTPVIPGYQQLALDTSLHAENMRQSGVNGSRAIRSGQPLPETVGAPASQVQSLVANAAHDGGVDANNALAVLRIESSNGQNLGVRGTLGQDRESAGKSAEEQAKALCDNLRTANQQAGTVLGRQAEGWEGYAVYQQGAGGGTALLKALQTAPNAKAVDVLEPLYQNPKDALNAVIKNGGNVTMSVADFTGHIKQLYNDNAARANCDFSGAGEKPGDAIAAPHQQGGEAVQPAATPIQALLNFDKKAPDILSRINAIPNYETRAGVMKAYKDDREKYANAAGAYTTVLMNQVGKLAVDPGFTSIDQIPPEVRASLVLDHPQSISYLETRAKYNADHQAGNTDKWRKDYGTAYDNLFHAVLAPEDDPGRITSEAQLQKYVGSTELTPSGYDKLVEKMKAIQKSPPSAAQTRVDAASREAAKMMITHGMNNPVTAAAWAAASPAVEKAIEDRKAAGIPASEYNDQESKYWIGNDVKAMAVNKSRALAAQIEANKAAGKIRPASAIAADALIYKNDPGKLAALKREAQDGGYFDPEAPLVPMAGQ